MPGAVYRTLKLGARKRPFNAVLTSVPANCGGVGLNALLGAEHPPYERLEKPYADREIPDQEKPTKRAGEKTMTVRKCSYLPSREP